MVQDPVVALPTNSSVSDKGQALRSALALSRANVPHPTSWDAWKNPLLNAAGVKNWKAFSKEATSVCVEWDDAGIGFVPYANNDRGGSVEILDGRSVVETPISDEALGTALERALTLAR